MEASLWMLLAAVIWFGISITRELRSIAEETKTIRQFLQKDGELKLVSIPAHALNVLEQLTEQVLQNAKSRNRSNDAPDDAL
jgi:hypothetical protein